MANRPATAELRVGEVTTDGTESGTPLSLPEAEEAHLAGYHVGTNWFATMCALCRAESLPAEGDVSKPVISLDGLLDLKRNEMTDMEVAHLTRPQREARVEQLIAEAHEILRLAEKTCITDQNRRTAATVLLFSGGNDSTTLAHLFRRHATHVAHANTGIGVEATRQFVRDTCATWGLPLLERAAQHEHDTYDYLVQGYGFPGPGAHAKMYQRLKERALDQVRRELVKRPYRERALFIAGRRRQESGRRAMVPELEIRGSTVWVSPFVNWTKLDLNTYRLMAGDVPRNEVTDKIHMSGECLCLAFAHEGEVDEIGDWFPEPREQARRLEAVLASYAPDYIPWQQVADIDRGRARNERRAKGDQALLDRLNERLPTPRPIPAWAKTWGWGADPELLRISKEKPSKSGPLCSSCDSRATGGQIIVAPTLFDESEATDAA